MKSIRLLTCSIVLTCIFAATVHADVTKRQFAADIQAEMIKVLSAHKGGATPPDEKLIADRAAAFAQAIELIPSESIDDATAKWIRESGLLPII